MSKNDHQVQTMAMGMSQRTPMLLLPSLDVLAERSDHHGNDRGVTYHRLCPAPDQIIGITQTTNGSWEN